MQTLLTIAGFDPGSGAGITADLTVMLAHGFFGTSAITALTVQSTAGVRETHPVAPSLLAATLECLADDLPTAGVKVGMLATAANVQVVGDFLARRCFGVPVVLDPVLRSSSGAELLEAAGVKALGDLLTRRHPAHGTGVDPAQTWITPNVAELEALSGLPVRAAADVEGAAMALGARWPGLGIVATGGHLDRPRDLVLSPGEAGAWIEGERIESRSTHGTGCAFSTAFLCGLVARGVAMEAARAAKHFVAEGIRRAEPRGSGAGPLDLIWPVRGGAGA